jgi:hypothetical protein
MKLTLLSAAAAAALTVGAGTASAQYPVLVPHRNHFHVVPAYPVAPTYGSYGYFRYNPYSGSTSLGFGRSYSPGFGYGGYYGSPWGGHHHGHHHHGHHHHGHHHHR